MEERDKLMSHSQELNSAVSQLKAKDGQMAFCSHPVNSSMHTDSAMSSNLKFIF